MGVFSYLQILELNDNQITSVGARAIFTWLKVYPLFSCTVVAASLIIAFDSSDTECFIVWCSAQPIVTRTSAWKQ